jgi:hypothetical protein
MEFICQLEQAFQELVNPGLRQVLWQGERQECSDRSASHGGDIAEAASEAAMANGLGGMPLAPEVNPFQAEIGSNHNLMTRGNLKDGAIVTDAGGYSSSSCSPTPNARDQQFFSDRQRELNIQYKGTDARNLLELPGIHGGVGPTRPGFNSSIQRLLLLGAGWQGVRQDRSRRAGVVQQEFTVGNPPKYP